MFRLEKGESNSSRSKSKNVKVSGKGNPTSRPFLIRIYGLLVCILITIGLIGLLVFLRIRLPHGDHVEYESVEKRVVKTAAPPHNTAITRPIDGRDSQEKRQAPPLPVITSGPCSSQFESCQTYQDLDDTGYHSTCWDTVYSIPGCDPSASGKCSSVSWDCSAESILPEKTKPGGRFEVPWNISCTSNVVTNTANPKCIVTPDPETRPRITDPCYTSASAYASWYDYEVEDYVKDYIYTTYSIEGCGNPGFGCNSTSYDCTATVATKSEPDIEYTKSENIGWDTSCTSTVVSNTEEPGCGITSPPPSPCETSAAFCWPKGYNYATGCTTHTWPIKDCIPPVSGACDTTSYKCGATPIYDDGVIKTWIERCMSDVVVPAVKDPRCGVVTDGPSKPCKTTASYCFEDESFGCTTTTWSIESCGSPVSGECTTTSYDCAAQPKEGYGKVTEWNAGCSTILAPNIVDAAPSCTTTTPVTDSCVLDDGTAISHIPNCPPTETPVTDECLSPVVECTQVTIVTLKTVADICNTLSYSSISDCPVATEPVSNTPTDNTCISSSVTCAPVTAVDLITGNGCTTEYFTVEGCPNATVTGISTNTTIPITDSDVSRVSTSDPLGTAIFTNTTGPVIDSIVSSLFTSDLLVTGIDASTESDPVTSHPVTDPNTVTSDPGSSDPATDSATSDIFTDPVTSEPETTPGSSDSNTLGAATAPVSSNSSTSNPDTSVAIATSGVSDPDTTDPVAPSTAVSSDPDVSNPAPTDDVTSGPQSTDANSPGSDAPVTESSDPTDLFVINVAVPTDSQTVSENENPTNSPTNDFTTNSSDLTNSHTDSPTDSPKDNTDNTANSPSLHATETDAESLVEYPSSSATNFTGGGGGGSGGGGGGGGGGSSADLDNNEDPQALSSTPWPSYPLPSSLVANHVPLVLARGILMLLTSTFNNLNTWEPIRELLHPAGIPGSTLAAGQGTGFSGIGLGTVGALVANVGVAFVPGISFVDTTYCLADFEREKEILTGNNIEQPCAPRIAVNPHIIDVCIIALGLNALVLAVAVAKWFKKPSNITADPTTIAGVAAVMGHPEVNRQFSSFPADLSAKGLAVRLKGQRFKLGEWQATEGEAEVRWGIIPVTKSEVAEQTKPGLMERIKARFTPGDGGDGEKDLRCHHQQEKDTPESWWRQTSLLVDILMLLLLLPLLVIVLAALANIDNPSAIFPPSLTSSSWGGRVIFALLGTLVAAYWGQRFGEAQTMAPYHVLSSYSFSSTTSTSSTEVAGVGPRETILLEKHSIPLTAILPLFLAGHVAAASVALVALLAEFLVVALAGLPYRKGQLRMEFLVCGVLAAVFLGAMVGQIVWSVLYRKRIGVIGSGGGGGGRRDEMPRKPDSVAAVMTYVAETEMVRDFEGLETMGTKKRNRAVVAMGKRYGYGLRIQGTAGAELGSKGGSVDADIGYHGTAAMNGGGRERGSEEGSIAAYEKDRARYRWVVDAVGAAERTGLMQRGQRPSWDDGYSSSETGELDGRYGVGHGQGLGRDGMTGTAEYRPVREYGTYPAA